MAFQDCAQGDYLIVVDGFGSGEGDFTLAISCDFDVPSPTPSGSAMPSISPSPTVVAINDTTSRYDVVFAFDGSAPAPFGFLSLV